MYGKYGELNPMYGKTHTDEIKQKLSLINKIQFTNEQIKQIIEFRNNGYSVCKISKIFNVSRTPIWRILKENNIN
jgi:DNA invertase Pin-like site-specific DNA recombinase